MQSLVDGGLIGLMLTLLFVTSPFLVTVGIGNYYLAVGGGIVSIFTSFSLWFDSLFLYNHVVILYASVVILLFCSAQNVKGHR